MPDDTPKPIPDSVEEPQIRVSPVQARQGRMGKQTLTVLVVSLVLAIVAGILVGLIPFRGM